MLGRMAEVATHARQAVANLLLHQSRVLSEEEGDVVIGVAWQPRDFESVPLLSGERLERS